jgi:hypothetical protein
VRSQKKLYLNEHSRILTGHPYMGGDLGCDFGGVLGGDLGG